MKHIHVHYLFAIIHVRSPFLERERERQREAERNRKRDRKRDRKRERD